MVKKNKGFTLIELLAVIVILAIIALIATPMILNVIEKARRGAVKESGNGYIEAVDKYQLEGQLDSTMYQIPKNTVIKVNACETTCLRDLIEVKGEKPSGSEDYIKLDSKGIIEEGRLTFQGYEVTIQNGKVESVAKAGETQNQHPEEVVFESILATTDFPLVVAIDSEGTLLALDYANLQMLEIKSEIKFINANIFKGSTDYIGLLGIDTNGSLWHAKILSSSEENLGEIGESIKIKEGTKFKSISTGDGYFMAIDEEGNLWGWGANDAGQLGDGTTTDKTEPIQIMAGTKFQSVSAGRYHTAAIDVDGNLWSWGYTINDVIIFEPVLIKEGTRFKSISAGDGCFMAIDVEGNLWSWGYVFIGDSTTGYREIPFQIKEGTIFKSVSLPMRSINAMAIDSEGNLWGWGQNEEGKLGDGTTTGKTEPIQITPETKFKSVSLGAYTTAAIDIDGNLWILWTYGTNVSMPVKIQRLQK